MPSVTFWQSVRNLREHQRIPRQWRAGDIQPHLKLQFSKHTIRTLPANQSISRDGKVKGNYVLRGMEEKAFRLGTGCMSRLTIPAIEGQRVAAIFPPIPAVSRHSTQISATTRCQPPIPALRGSMAD
jgi:hypothetical protein